MSRGDSGDSKSSGYIRRYRTPSPQPRDPDAKIRLARIIISHDGINEYDWDGTKPNPGDTLFLYYVEVSDETYRSYIPLDTFRQEHIQKITKHETRGSERYTMEERTFEQLRGIKNGVTISYLHNTNNDRRTNTHINRALYGHIETHQAELLPSLIKNGNIFQNNKDFSYWYMLNGPDAYSDEYYRYREGYDFLDVKVYDDLNPSEYMSISNFVTRNPELKILIRETGASHGCFRCIKKKQGGGKTRRKFKVKKRRNRRIRNTMKRRKTAVKRRKTALKRRNR